MLKCSDFDYVLPPELIAQNPAERRDGSRMMVLDAKSGATQILPFPRIADYLERADLLVCNNTKVMRCRLFGRKNGLPDGAKFEILLVSVLSGDGRIWKALLRPGKRALPGTRVFLTDDTGAVNARGDFFTVLGRLEEEAFQIEFSSPDWERIQQTYGHIPLPPYIRRADAKSDAERYQTIFAEAPGAVAAPTAGLHFSPEVMAHLAAKGVETAHVTLHVGPGTFKPVEVEDISQHHMHKESFFIPQETADRIAATRRAGHKVLAVGTTTVRSLESRILPDGNVTSGGGDTEIFLYPPREILCCDMLLTNFHLPKSTLMMLVACLTGRENLLAAYAKAVEEKMRFYSYGDCMLIVK